MNKNTRDYLFDNYKAFLIVLVVVGHFVDVASADNSVLTVIKWLIFSFHMPAFIFISGYFSRRTYSIGALAGKLLVPYLFFEIFYYVLYTYVIHKETQLYLLHPKFTLWYLMALFVWKLVTPWVKKIPGHTILAIVAGLFVGASGLDDNFLTLPRMIVFYPFFLMGVDFDREIITKLKSRGWQKKGAVVVAALCVMIAAVALSDILSPKIFYGRYDYEYLGMSVGMGMAVRFVCYGISIVMTILLAVILPEGENRFSYLGSRTMAIYLFHGLVYSCFRGAKTFCSSMPNALETLFVLGVSLLVVWVLAREPFTRFTNTISNLYVRQKK